MGALRAVCKGIGLAGAQTCLQSGNVVFSIKEKDLKPAAGRIEAVLEKDLGIRTVAVIRSLAELRDVTRRNPFAARSGIEPGKLLVTFLVADPDKAGCEKVRQMQIEPEELRIDGREIYTYFPNGMARPNFSMIKVEKALKTSGTGRNWNTLMKMIAIAEKLERDVG